MISEELRFYLEEISLLELTPEEEEEFYGEDAPPE